MKKHIHNPDLYQISLKVILKNKNGEVLLLRIPDTSYYGGFYDYPGGRINIGEFDTDYQTLIKRELEEEIGPKVRYSLSLDPVSFSRQPYVSKRLKKEFRVLLLFFEAAYSAGEIMISDEHSDFCWVRLNHKNIKTLFTAGMREGMQRYLNLRHQVKG